MADANSGHPPDIAKAEGEPATPFGFGTTLENARGHRAPPGGDSEAQLPTRLGPYELLERVGKGGMGWVWKARHTRLDKLVALKFLRPHLTSDPESIKRFEREMRAVGKLEHPNIVRATDAGEADGFHFLVMEYVEGQDLASLVRDHGPQPVAEVCRMIREAAQGLAHAHAHGLVHRDIKPSNLILARDGTVKVLDLGLALLQDDGGNQPRLTEAGVVVGTPDFMAPEQWDNSHAVGAPADLYSLGCTLFFLLTGRSPFGHKQGATYVQTMKAHVLERPPHLNDVLPDLPAALGNLCARLLAKEPQQRLASAQELVAALADFAPLDGGQSSPLLTATNPSGRTTLRRPAGTIALVVGIVAGALFFGLMLRPLLVPKARVESPPNVPAPAPTAAAGAMPPALAVAPFHADQAAAYQQEWADHLQVPVEYSNSIGLKLRLIPAGEFHMGNVPDETDRLLAEASQRNLPDWFVKKLPSEQPRHVVTLSRPIFVGVYEVTQRQYAEVMGTNPAYYAAGHGGGAKVGNGDTADLPVESVNWYDAAEFCTRLSRREQLDSFYDVSGAAATWRAGTGYRLLTEAEWEFACRAGTQSRYWCGETSEKLSTAAWYSATSGERPRAIGQLQSNPFGLYDTHGNVWEWCQGAADPAAYAARNETKSVDPEAIPQTLAGAAARGGSWRDPDLICRSANRGYLRPDAAGSGVGFRVALTASAVQAALASGSTSPVGQASRLP